MKWILGIVFCWLSILVFGQTYTQDRQKFLKEFSKSIGDYADNDDKKFVKDQLEVMLIESNDFPDTYFQQMITTSNKIIEKRMDAYPEVYNYVFSVYSLRSFLESVGLSIKMIKGIKEPSGKFTIFCFCKLR